MLKSDSIPERIALIEFDSSHDECLLTQVNALKKHGSWVLLVTNDIIRNRNQQLESLVDEWIDIDSRGLGFTGAAIGDAMIVRRLMRRLKEEKIDRAVFNTAQGGHVRNACLFSLFRKIEFVGIIHTIRKFQGSFTQKVISLKIKKYFVLSTFLKEHVPFQKNIKIETFYPIDFPNVKGNFELKGQTHISLIGTVEKRRKDLDGFLSLIQQCDAKVTFSFLGKADPANSEVIEFKKNLAEINCLDRVEFFDNYVSSEIINQILRKTTAILPIIHPNTPSAVEYFRHQIPGAMNIALGYKIPLLLPEQFKKISELRAGSCYYQMDQFSSAIEELMTRHSSIQKTMTETEAFSNSWNQDRYLQFLLS